VVVILTHSLSRREITFFQHGSGLGADFTYGNHDFQVKRPRCVEHKLKYNIKYI